MKRVRAKPGNAGFTLVEALLATLLAGVVLGVLATLTARWLPNWDRGLVRMQRADLLATGLDRLLADLAAAEFVASEPGSKLPVFEGAKSSVTFVRTTIGPNSFDGLEIVRIAEAHDYRGPALVRQSAPFVLAGPTAIAKLGFSDPIVLVRAPYAIAFSYAGPDRVWRDAWHGLPQLPRAVRVMTRNETAVGEPALTTSTLISAELPARCATKKLDECGERASADAAPAGSQAASVQGR